MLRIIATVLFLSNVVQAQKTATPYPRMAPLDQYLIGDRAAEIALARSAAPKSIADHAEVMVLERQGYKTAVQGTNGFVCMVERSWTAGFGDPTFWNPKIRGPICFNPPAARTYLPIVIARTRLALAGKSEKQMLEAIDSALDKKELPALEAGAMSYMLSKQGYLNDQAGHWHPHLMFWAERTEAKAWGAGMPGSPVIGAEEIPGRLTIFMIPVGEWSDGTPDSHDGK
ncbi:MAG TPA: hypothetical protein VMH80_23550 [Bryobacteraceae bacterium]|nr:hypothetical protein [Bryobacteraceae bacterium]